MGISRTTGRDGARRDEIRTRGLLNDAQSRVPIPRPATDEAGSAKQPAGRQGSLHQSRSWQFHIRYPHSKFTIRFDKGKLHTFPFDSSDDGRSNLAILGDNQYDRFIALLRKAKTMDIEVDFYGEGSQVVTFDVHGLQGW